MRLTKFDHELYDVILATEMEQGSVMVFYDELEGKQYIPIEYFYVRVAKRHWKKDIEDKIQKSLNRLRANGLITLKDVAGSSLCKTNTPHEIVACKKSKA